MHLSWSTFRPAPWRSLAAASLSAGLPSGCRPRRSPGANGAGDAFAAGFLYGYHQGWSLDELVALAHAAAAASLRAISTTGSLEPWQTAWRSPALGLARGDGVTAVPAASR